MADVRLRLILTALVAVKAIDMNVEWGPAAAAVWVALAAVTVLGQRWWLTMAALAIPAAWLGEHAMSSGHAVLIAWVALVLGTTSGRDTERGLRTLVVSVYLFGALNKLSLDYMSGATIDDRNVPPPEAVFATAGLLLEAFLVWAVWRRSWLALPVAAALHAGIVLTLGTVSLYELVRLGSFNAIMVVLVWATTRPSGNDASPPRPSISTDRVIDLDDNVSDDAEAVGSVEP